MKLIQKWNFEFDKLFTIFNYLQYLNMIEMTYTAKNFFWKKNF